MFPDNQENLNSFDGEWAKFKIKMKEKHPKICKVMSKFKICMSDIATISVIILLFLYWTYLGYAYSTGKYSLPELNLTQILN